MNAPVPVEADDLSIQEQAGWTVSLHQDGQLIWCGSAEVTFPSTSLSLAGLSPNRLRALEWSDRKPCIGTSGAWLSCPCCGAVKIDLAGHEAGCPMAAAIVDACGTGDATIEPGEGVAPWLVRFPDGGGEEFRGLGPGETGEFGARLRQQQWRATVGRDLDTGAPL